VGKSIFFWPEQLGEGFASQKQGAKKIQKKLKFNLGSDPENPNGTRRTEIKSSSYVGGQLNMFNTMSIHTIGVPLVR